MVERARIVYIMPYDKNMFSIDNSLWAWMMRFWSSPNSKLQTPNTRYHMVKESKTQS